MTENKNSEWLNMGEVSRHVGQIWVSGNMEHLSHGYDWKIQKKHAMERANEDENSKVGKTVTWWWAHK